MDMVRVKELDRPVVEVLREARALITEPEHWTQCVYAGSAEHHNLDPLDPRADRWCLMGALRKVTNTDLEHDLPRSLRDPLEAIVRPGSAGLTTFNDTRAHPAILAVLDEAIAKLEATA